MGRLIHWHWHSTIKQLTVASLFRVLLLWTWPFRASKIFIIVFRVQAAVKLSQLEGNLSNSLDFFIHSITPQSLFHGPAPFFAGFHPIPSVLFAFSADTQALLLNVLFDHWKFRP